MKNRTIYLGLVASIILVIRVVDKMVIDVPTAVLSCITFACFYILVIWLQLEKRSKKSKKSKK